MYVTFTQTFIDDGSIWTCDKTFAELKAAHDAGSIIFGSFAPAVFPMVLVTEGGITAFIGSTIIAGGQSSITSLAAYDLGVLSDDSVYARVHFKQLTT